MEQGDSVSLSFQLLHFHKIIGYKVKKVLSNEKGLFQLSSFVYLLAKSWRSVRAKYLCSALKQHR